MIAVKTHMRRFDPRTEALTEVDAIVQRNGASFMAVVRDVSDHGMRLAVEKHFETGERVRVYFHLPTQITLTGRVRWCHATSGDDPYHIGLEVESDFGFLVALQRYVTKTGF